jgi:hypothetical protein
MYHPVCKVIGKEEGDGASLQQQTWNVYEETGRSLWVSSSPLGFEKLCKCKLIVKW